MTAAVRARLLIIDFIDGSRSPFFVGRSFIMPAKNNFDIKDIDGNRHIINMDKVKSVTLQSHFQPRPPQPPNPMLLMDKEI